MKDYNIILNNVKKIVCEFLKDQGGYSNGLDTYVKGSIKVGIHYSLDWMTPKSQDLTIKEHKRLGYELNDRICEYLKQIEFYDYIYITSYEIDYGCYITKVSIKIEEPIRMDDF